jgi:hypothetical protein
VSSRGKRVKFKKDLMDKGFQGFQSIRELRGNNFSNVPERAGVYAAIRINTDEPVEILDRCQGGRFKGKSPTQPVSKLREHWVDGAEVLYIGKVGGPTNRPDRTLKARISEFICFGDGVPCGHWGGRSIWQLRGSDEFLIAWLEAENPRALEKKLIMEF